MCIVMYHSYCIPLYIIIIMGTLRKKIETNHCRLQRTITLFNLGITKANNTYRSTVLFKNQLSLNLDV